MRNVKFNFSTHCSKTFICTFQIVFTISVFVCIIIILCELVTDKLEWNPKSLMTKKLVFYNRHRRTTNSFTADSSWFDRSTSLSGRVTKFSTSIISVCLPPALMHVQTGCQIYAMRTYIHKVINIRWSWHGWCYEDGWNLGRVWNSVTEHTICY